MVVPIALSALLIANGVVTAMLALYAWGQKGVRGNRFFSLMMFAMAEYAVSLGVEMLAPGIPAKIFWSKVQYIGACSVGPLWLLFAVSYAGHGRWLTWRRAASLWVVPVAGFCMVATNESHGLVWPSVRPLTDQPGGPLEYVHGPAVLALAFYVHALMIVGAVLLARVAYRSGRLYRMQMAALLAAAALPLWGNISYFLGMSPFRGFDLAPFFLTASGGLITWAIFRFRLLRATPVVFDAVLAGMADGIVLLNPDDRVTEINRAAEAFLGLKRDVLGLPVVKALAQWPAMLACGVGKSVEIGPRDSGPGLRSILWLEVRRSLLRDSQGTPLASLLLVRDITERKRAEEAVIQREADLHATLNATADAILAVDENGKVLFTNTRFRDMWRVPQALLEEGANDALFAHVLDQVADPKTFLARVKELSSSEEEDFDSLLFRDGRNFECYSTVLPKGGGGTGRVWSFRDVTERERAAEQKRQIEAKMQHTQKLESLGVLAGGIAHDFNNILMAIVGNVDLALNALSASSPVRPFLGQVEKGAQRASDLTRQMLAYSGRGRFTITAIDLGELAAELGGLLNASIPKRVALRMDLAEDLPLIEGDTAQSQQIIMNLVTNAAEAYGEEGTGEVVIATGVTHCGRLGLAEGVPGAKGLAEGALVVMTPDGNPLPVGDYVYVQVVDHGCGMDKETKAKLFDPFFTTKFAGRGLGMAAVLGIVRGHKGAIHLDTAPGEGAVFRVPFPAAPDAVRSAPASVPAAEPAPKRECATVLVVDDEQEVREVVQQMLEMLGFSVLVAKGGREALEIYQERLDEVGCVLLDLSMPGMDGQEVFQELRRIDPHVRIALSSGYDEREVKKRFSGQGLSGFVAKPYRLATLDEKIRGILGAESPVSGDDPRGPAV